MRWRLQKTEQATNILSYDIPSDDVLNLFADWFISSLVQRDYIIKLRPKKFNNWTKDGSIQNLT